MVRGVALLPRRCVCRVVLNNSKARGCFSTIQPLFASEGLRLATMFLFALCTHTPSSSCTRPQTTVELNKIYRDWVDILK
jgi:hypothetical protein